MLSTLECLYLLNWPSIPMAHKYNTNSIVFVYFSYQVWRLTPKNYQLNQNAYVPVPSRGYDKRMDSDFGISTGVSNGKIGFLLQMVESPNDARQNIQTHSTAQYRTTNSFRNTKIYPTLMNGHSVAGWLNILTLLNVFPNDFHILISVRSRLLVPKSNCMH